MEGIKCKDCYWYSDVTCPTCERIENDPCDPEAEACDLYESKEDNV